MRFAALALASSILIAGPALAASNKGSAKEPPSCSALSFRSMPPGAPDGEQEAGMYRSRFVRMELKAIVEGGTARNYFLVLNGKRVEPLAGGVPAGAAACLKAKNVQVPVQDQPSGTCTGDRFRVVLDRSTKEPVAMLFGLHGSTWKHCTTSKA